MASQNLNGPGRNSTGLLSDRPLPGLITQRRLHYSESFSGLSWHCSPVEGRCCYGLLVPFDVAHGVQTVCMGLIERTKSIQESCVWLKLWSEPEDYLWCLKWHWYFNLCNWMLPVVSTGYNGSLDSSTQVCANIYMWIL